MLKLKISQGEIKMDNEKDKVNTNEQIETTDELKQQEKLETMEETLSENNIKESEDTTEVAGETIEDVEVDEALLNASVDDTIYSELIDDEDNQLSKSELHDLLNELEKDKWPSRRTPKEPPKKKAKIRFDMIIAAVIAAVVVAGAVILISHFTSGTKSKDAQAVSENPLLDEKYPEISDVVKNYLNAFLIEDDQKRADTIAQYVGNLYDINSVKQRKYVSDYSEIECYTKNGPYANTYVVFAYYKMTLVNIDTPVPSIDRLYVVRDAKTGNVYIQNDSGEDIQKYMNEITKNSDVQQLLKDVQNEFEQVKEKDPKVKEYFDKVQSNTKESTTQNDAQTTKEGTTTVASTTAKGTTTTKAPASKK